MAKLELRKAVSALMDEKSKWDAQATQHKDKLAVLQQQFQEARNSEHGYREAKETLPRSNASRPATIVFDREIANSHKQAEDLLKEIEAISKQLDIVVSKAKALDKSIRELQNA